MFIILHEFSRRGNGNYFFLSLYHVSSMALSPFIVFLLFYPHNMPLIFQEQKICFFFCHTICALWMNTLSEEVRGQHFKCYGFKHENLIYRWHFLLCVRNGSQRVLHLLPLWKRVIALGARPLPTPAAACLALLLRWITIQTELVSISPERRTFKIIFQEILH